MRNIFYYLLLFSILLFARCRKEEQISDSPDLKLEFTNDTLFFDTIFNTIGSSTKNFKIYNRNKRAVKISNIRLKEITPGYQINVDGVNGTNFNDIEINAGDSLYVFVEVTVNPNDELHPFVEDDLEFNTNGNLQTVKLVAWGWDAIIYKANVFPTNGLPPYVVIDTNLNSETTWDGTKPILIYGGFAVVDSSTSLIIAAGTEIFSHYGSGLWVYRYGSLHINGTAEAPVVFQGDRLEEAYKENPGQWDRIWINEGATADDVNIDYCVIKNAFVGLQLETVPFITAPLDNSIRKARLNNVAVRNCSLYGIYCRNFNVDANNVLVSNCGFYTFAVSGGGSYNFNHSTFANYWSESNRTTPTFAMTNSYESAPGVIKVNAITNSHFSNTIIYGKIEDEFQIELNDGVVNDLKFEYSIIKSNTAIFNDAERFGTNIFGNQDPGFAGANDGDYNLIPSAFAIDTGSATTSIPNPNSFDATFDLLGFPRVGAGPDIGALEFHEP